MKLERIGFVQAIGGNELYVHTTTDELVRFVAKDRSVQNHFYCKYVKITIEELPEDFVKRYREKHKV